MGEYDLVEAALAEMGAEFLFTGSEDAAGEAGGFWAAARRQRCELGERYASFGLPGNPVSTQVTFHCFVEPLLRAMCGSGSCRGRGSCRLRWRRMLRERLG